MMICTLATRAQYDPVYSHYFDMEPTFNPASVGKQEKLNVTAAYALSFAGFENNPRTFQVAGDMPFLFLNQRHGAGLGLQSDQIGLFTHQKLTLQYAFRKKMLGGTVSLGVQGGVISEKFEEARWSWVNLETPPSPQPMSTEAGSTWASDSTINGAVGMPACRRSISPHPPSNWGKRAS